jgi:hypothetical protein
MSEPRAIVNANANAAQSTLEYLASMAIEKAGLSAVGSAMISPAIWTTNYVLDQKAPGAADVVLWGHWPYPRPRDSRSANRHRQRSCR